MKIFVDENIPLLTVAALRDLGHMDQEDAITEGMVFGEAWEEVERGVVDWIESGEDDGSLFTSRYFAVWCESRASFPKWLSDAVDNAADGAREGRAGFAYLKQKFSRDADDLIVLRWGDFAELIAHTDLDAYVEARAV